MIEHQYRLRCEIIQADADGTHGGEPWWKPKAFDKDFYGAPWTLRTIARDAQLKRAHPDVYRNVVVETRVVITNTGDWRTADL